MLIGFTYNLKERYLDLGFSAVEAAEFDSPETIDGIEESLLRLGHRVRRIGGLGDLVAALAGGERWDLVFNIAEGLRGPTREAQIPALLEAYGIPVVFSDSLTLALALHKGFCNEIVRQAGIPVAPFAVIDSPEAADAVHGLAYPLFVKPVAEGTGKGVSARGRIERPGDLRPACAELLRTFRQPVIVEEYLPGREFTVGVVGTGADARVLGVMEVLLLENAEGGVYSYENKDKYEDRVRYRLAPPDAEASAAAELALAGYRLLGCRDAGRVDVRSDARNKPRFLEINPLAGLNPLHSDLPILCRLLGMSFDSLVAAIVGSAEKRVKHGANHRNSPPAV